MKQPDSSKLERLMALVEEAEQLLARGIPTHDIRQACAVARGYLELALSYDEPVNVEDVERVLEKMRSTFVARKPGTTTEADQGLLGPA